MNYSPSDLSHEGKLAIEQGYSHRCPYSIHNQQRVSNLITDIDDERISYKAIAIDYREEALKYTIEPLNWEWLYISGREIEYFFKSKEELEEEIKSMLDDLG
ncbi:MAG: hypothetical protein R6W73_06740 [Candidatus Saliniplasma sp.]